MRLSSSMNVRASMALLVAAVLLLADAVVLFSEAQNSSWDGDAAGPGAFLDPHNDARNRAGVAPLEWSTALAEYALSYAETQVDRCVPLTHSHGPYGENLFWGSGKAWTPGDAVASWTGEVDDYDYASNSCRAGKMCGHYTQVVWASTTHVGCSSVICTQHSANYIICSYHPPGNWIGQRPF